MFTIAQICFWWYNSSCMPNIYFRNVRISLFKKKNLYNSKHYSIIFIPNRLNNKQNLKDALLSHFNVRNSNDINISKENSDINECLNIINKYLLMNEKIINQLKNVFFMS
jgi:hypothetical protein